MSSALDSYFTLFSKIFCVAAGGAFLCWLKFASPALKKANDAKETAEGLKASAETKADAIKKEFDAYKNRCDKLVDNMEADLNKIGTLTSQVERLTTENETLRKMPVDLDVTALEARINTLHAENKKLTTENKRLTAQLKAGAELNESSNCNSNASGGGSSSAVKSAPGVTVGGVTYSTFRDWYTDVNYTIETGESPYDIFSMKHASGLPVDSTWKLANFCRELVKTGSCKIAGCLSKGHTDGQKLCVEGKVVLVCTVSNDTKTYAPFVPRRAAASSSSISDPVVVHSAEINVVNAPLAANAAGNNNVKIQQEPFDTISDASSSSNGAPEKSKNQKKREKKAAAAALAQNNQPNNVSSVNGGDLKTGGGSALGDGNSAGNANTTPPLEKNSFEDIDA